MVAGRSTESRTVAGVGTTATSTAITFPANAIVEEDAGRPISGSSIPAGATIATVTSTTAGTLSVAATAIATITATVGGTGGTAGASYGFVGWSPETDPESETYSLAAVNAGSVPPDRLTNPFTAVSQRSRG